MLSVIQPSSNNLGSFPSHPYLPSEPSGYSQYTTGGQFYNYYDKKWALQPQISSWTMPSSYLLQSQCYNGAQRGQSRRGHPSNSSSLRASNYALIYPESHRSSRAPLESSPAPSSLPTKDYSKPLFVDCSIEYELPNAPKVPKNSEPILMIHPAYRASKRAKRVSTKSSSSSSSAVGIIPKNQLQKAHSMPVVSSTGILPVSGTKRSYTQMSTTTHPYTTDSYIPHHQPTQHYPMPCCTPAYDSSCYPSYDNSSKRSCRRSPTDLAGFRRQQHLMHLQAQFSLYVRRQETFWT